jgi:hypothetical protein
MKDEWLALSAAVQHIAGLLDGESDKARERNAAGELYDELRRGGHVRSRAGRVHLADGPGSTWSLANWVIPPAVWQVTTIYEFSKNFTVTWTYPANESKPAGWPDRAVKLSDVEVCSADIHWRWPLPKSHSTRGPSVAAVSDFLISFADGTKTEAECLEAAKEHFAVKSIPEKNIWRPALQAVPASKKVRRGGGRKPGK